jgi:hypothetical protein
MVVNNSQWWLIKRFKHYNIYYLIYIMSGQPVKTVEDQRRFKDEYMENLALRAKLDDENLRANLIFSESGMIPPVSSLPDNRTVEDKMLDIEGLKQGIISDLKGLMNPTMAATFVQELMKSKFNAGNALLKFFSQRGPEFTKELLKKYKYGLADFNDIVGTLKFVEKYFLDAQESMVGIKDVFGRARDSTPRFTFDQGIELDKLIRQLQILLTREGLNITSGIIEVIALVQDLEKFRKLIPPEAVINKWGTDLTGVLNNSQVNDTEIIKDLLEEYKIIQDLLLALPSYDVIQSIIFGLKKSLAYNGTNEEKFNKSSAYLSVLKTEIQQWLGNLPNRDFTLIRNMMTDFRNKIDRLKDWQINERNITEIENQNMDNLRQGLYDFNQMYGNQRVNNNNDFFDANDGNNFQIRPPSEEKDEQGAQESKGNGVRRRGRPKMRGGNISQPKIFETRIDYNSGIKASPDFVPFGAYLLNRRKINDGIISIKTMKGGTVIGYPNKRVSSNLSKVINQIIGGGVPSYELLSSLDDEEKAYLYKISKKTKLSDKLSIPSPSKDQTEKDIHNFEVMKGQILSGNDSKTLIKNFKILVLKLKTQGLLPKSQADELLSDLLSLGY